LISNQVREHKRSEFKHYRRSYFWRPKSFKAQFANLRNPEDCAQ
jgi:hypothetical protein